ncbi:MAG: molybdopterin-binding protein [Deltaproteobacteria bacterium]|nr:molybdopterin-binding protein [Deltaproteobacteria bacterium]
MDWNLLEKTTFWIDGIALSNADLGRLADVASGVLGLGAKEVIVVDVRPGVIAFDILAGSVRAENVIGKEKELLGCIAGVPGVRIGSRARVHSEGVLGLISLDPAEGERVLADSAAIASEIDKIVSRRVLVFASGSELIEGNIRDTNSPYLLEELAAAGYKAEFGGILEDSLPAAASVLDGAIGRGYGLVFTTGGVGAEDKDFNIEAILRLDPQAHTPWILKFTPDMGRHHKEGVRIAVGRVGVSRLIALPGPHEEVRLAWSVLKEGLGSGVGDAKLANDLADALRQRWITKMTTKGSGHRHEHAGDF